MPTTVSTETVRAVKEKVLPRAARKRGSRRILWYERSITKEGGIPEVRFQLVKLKKNV